MATPSSTSPRRPRQWVSRQITVPAALQRACDEFNSVRFFECHETLEEIWQEEQGDVRDLYKGLIQLAAAFVHVTRGNFIGANRLLQTSVAYLAPYRAEGAMGFDVDHICREAEAAHAAVIALGPGRLDGFDMALVPALACAAARLGAEARRWSAWGFDAAGSAIAMTIDVLE
ncbi:MAG: DUF309 domain-containing protein [Chloroflexi bacterium]|nr:DUF309 domain-containing protein [Chloroflexota bacterium]